MAEEADSRVTDNGNGTGRGNININGDGGGGGDVRPNQLSRKKPSLKNAQESAFFNNSKKEYNVIDIDFDDHHNGNSNDDDVKVLII